MNIQGCCSKDRVSRARAPTPLPKITLHGRLPVPLLILNHKTRATCSAVPVFVFKIFYAIAGDELLFFGMLKVWFFAFVSSVKIEDRFF